MCYSTRLAELLPIHEVREAFGRALEGGPVVLSAPTGSGKSTEVPRWCPGRVLVIEPRRVACRSLASRVAQLEGCALGTTVGYWVRDERVMRDDTRILFATPGIVLRNRALLAASSTVVLDEFHERSLDIDLLLALFSRERPARLVVMSATLEAERIARHLGATALSAPGRAFPVAIRYLPGRTQLPDSQDLGARVREAIVAAAADPGDVLVFLPGKAEIDACAAELSGAGHVIPLHGGLPLALQQRAFEPARARKIILATNVAETSLTIPGIGVVIDSGLVRQTRYHAGRSYLALSPIAEDSATQRAGRAGRTAPGVCYRLWRSGAPLREHTPPEIFRESLVPLVLTAAAWGARVEELGFLDPPKDYALAAARAELQGWGALDGDSALSACGSLLFALPIDARHARMVVEARQHGCLDAMIDLVSVLAVGRPLFFQARSEVAVMDDVRADGCDAVAAIRALRSARPDDLGASSAVVGEARQVRARLRQIEGLPEHAASAAIDRDALIRAVLGADRSAAYVARERGREGRFSNGAAEVELSRESAARNVKKLEAVLALETRAFGADRDARVVVSCAMPIPLGTLARAGLGEDRLSSVRHERKRMFATIERVYGQRVLSTREESPRGELARQALVELLLRGSLFRDTLTESRTRHARVALAEHLAARQQPGTKAPVRPDFETWLRERVRTLGVESGDDLELLSANDFLLPDVPYEIKGQLDSDYPMTVSVGDATYRAEYDVERGQVMLHMLKGSRRDPPPLSYLPKFPGLKICVQTPRGIAIIRERG